MSARSSLIALLALAAPALSRAESIVVDFSDLTLPPDSFNDGRPDPPAFGSFDGTFTSGGATFRNQWNRVQFGRFVYDYWNGWAYSNVTDNRTPGFSNQYGSFAGGDASGDGIYAVAAGSGPSTVRLDLPEAPDPALVAVGMSAKFTNTTYAALSILEGDSFGPPFGAGDFFLLTILGYSNLGASGSVLGAVDFYLADFRAGASLVVDDWTTVDLSSLAGARSLGFRLTTTGIGPNGPYTPSYFAMDDLTITFAAIPEPASLAMLGLGLGAVAVVAGRRRRLGAA